MGSHSRIFLKDQVKVNGKTLWLKKQDDVFRKHRKTWLLETQRVDPRGKVVRQGLRVACVSVLKDLNGK